MTGTCRWPIGTLARTLTHLSERFVTGREGLVAVWILGLQDWLDVADGEDVVRLRIDHST